MTPLRVAAIHQPWSVVQPPVDTADSIALWTDQVMRRLSRSCRVICYSRQWQGLSEVTHHDNVEHRRMPVSIDRLVRKGMSIWEGCARQNASRPFFASKWCYRQFISSIAAQLRRRPVDVVHIQNFSQFVPVIRQVLPHARILLHMHAEWLAQLDRRWIGPRLAEADAVLFCSNFYAEQARQAWPGYAARCRTVYNGVDFREFEQSSQTPSPKHGKRLLFVSRISPDKGVHVLIDAFNKIVQKYPETELKLVGPFAVLPKSMCLNLTEEPIVRDLQQFYEGPPYLDQLKARLSSAAAQTTQITGAIPRQELVRQFQQADVYVMPSIYPEGFGIPIIEAAACRVPTVCTRRGGMPEVVDHGKTGLIVPPADADALSEAILYLLENEDHRRAMGQAAYERAAHHFTWDRIAHCLLDEYHRLEPPSSCGASFPNRLEPMRGAM